MEPPAGSTTQVRLVAELSTSSAHKKVQVSTRGRIKNKCGKIYTPKPSRSGYASVRINGKDYGFHRIMAATYIPPGLSDQTTVDHIDNDPGNNHLDNLQWLSQAEQNQKSHATNSNRASNALRRSKPVLAMEQGTDEWTRYDSVMAAARELGVDQGSISKICSKKRRSLAQRGGDKYVFKWADPNEPAVLPGETWYSTPVGTRVSSFGRFRSAHGVTTSPKPDKNGYVRITNGGGKESIHRLLAEAANIPGRSDLRDTVDHIDNDPSNNRLDNLQWLSRAEQNQKSHATNSTRGSCASQLSKLVLGKKRGTDEWTRYDSVMAAARELELDHGSISKICSKKRSSLAQKGGEIYVFKWGEPKEPELLPGEEWRDAVFPDGSVGGIKRTRTTQEDLDDANCFCLSNYSADGDL